jgi:hypothetical protein
VLSVQAQLEHPTSCVAYPPPSYELLVCKEVVNALQSSVCGSPMWEEEGVVVSHQNGEYDGFPAGDGGARIGPEHVGLHSHDQLAIQLSFLHGLNCARCGNSHAE